MRRLQCPYHAWSYGFDGTLRNAPGTDTIEGFEPRCFGLTPVRAEVLHGLVFVDLSGGAPPLAEHVGALEERLAGHRLGTLRRAAAVTLRRRRQLEGDRAELLRVPALPRRAPGAQPAHALPLRRRPRGAGRVVRRGDDAQRGRRDDGARRRLAGDRGRRRARGPLLRAAAQRADLAPPRLRDAAHAVAARGREDGGRLRVVLRAGDDGARGLRPRRRGRVLGHRQPPGLARLRAHAEGRRLARVLARALHRQRAHGAPVRPDGLRARTSAAPDGDLPRHGPAVAGRVGDGGRELQLRRCRPRASRAPDRLRELEGDGPGGARRDAQRSRAQRGAPLAEALGRGTGEAAADGEARSRWRRGSAAGRGRGCGSPRRSA